MQVLNLNHLEPLEAGAPLGGRPESLRAVLAVVLDPDTAHWCLGGPADVQEAPVLRWPSSLYGVLAHAALRSPAIWRRCALVVDRALHEELAPYTHRPAADLVHVFLEGRESLSGRELAAVLWCLVRRRCNAHDVLAERLGHELEIVAARRLAASSTSRAQA